MRLLGPPAHRAAVDDAARRDALEPDHREVLGHAHARGRGRSRGGPRGSPRRRPTPSRRPCRTARACRSTRTSPRVGIGSRLDSTSASVRWPLPSTPATPDDLAGANRERRARRAARGRRDRARRGRRLRARPARARCRCRAPRCPRVDVSTRPERDALGSQGHRPADHRRRQRGGVDRRGAHVIDDRPWRMIVTSSVGVQDLVELVADERDCAAFLHHAVAQRVEQLLALGRGQHRRRLVEDEDRRVAAQALDDLDPLAHADGQVADDRVGIDVQARTVRRAPRRGHAPLRGGACPRRRAPRSPTRAAARRG